MTDKNRDFVTGDEMSPELAKWDRRYRWALTAYVVGVAFAVIFFACTLLQ